MQLSLNDSEIRQAVADYVAGQGISVVDKKVDVVLKAGRGENGYSATVDITDNNSTESTEELSIFRE